MSKATNRNKAMIQVLEEEADFKGDHIDAPAHMQSRKIFVRILFYPAFVFLAILAVFGGSSLGGSDNNYNKKREGDFDGFD